MGKIITKPLKRGGEIKMEVWVFVIVHKFTTEDPAVQFYGVIANSNLTFEF